MTFLAGLAAGSTSSLPAGWIIWIGVAVVGYGISNYLQVRAPDFIDQCTQFIHIKPFILLVAFLLGWARFSLGEASSAKNNLVNYIDRGGVEVSGWVAEPPERYANSVRLHIAIDGITWLGAESSVHPARPNGLLLVRLSADDEYHYGDRLQLTGSLKTPDEGDDFLYREYLAGRGIFAVMEYPRVGRLDQPPKHPARRGIFTLRQAAYERLRQLLPSPESALLGGILLGIETDIPSEVERAFQDTGTSHVIVISGSNIAVLSILLAFFFRKLFSLRWSFILTVAGITVYTIMVGGDPPVVRAAFMGLLAGLASLLGRRQSGANSLAFTAAVMCLVDPGLLQSASFQLSFGATAGMLLLGGPLVDLYQRVAERFLSGETASRLARPISEYVLLTLAAQIGTFPIAAYHFHHISVSSFLANLLILPAQPPIMVLGGLTLALDFLFEPLGRMVALLTWVPLAYTIRIVETIASAWTGVWTINLLPAWAVFVFYALLIAALLPGLRPILKQAISLLQHRLRLNMAITILLFANLLVWHAALYRLDQNLRITALNEGSAVLLQSPKGRNLLINGAPNSSSLGRALAQRLGLFNSGIDILILTDQSSTALTGLIGLQNSLQPELALVSNTIPDSGALRRLQTIWSDKHTAISQLSDQQTIPLDENTQLRVLAVMDNGSALQITQDQFCLLIPGGVDPKVIFNETNTCPVGNRAVVILTAADLQNQDWVETWLAQAPAAVIAYNSQFGASSSTASPMIHTWQTGWLTITTDGEQLWLQSDRKIP